jgi:hypothetical protein
MKITTCDLLAMMEAWLADHPNAPRRITEHIKMDAKILQAYTDANRTTLSSNGQSKRNGSISE